MDRLRKAWNTITSLGKKSSIAVGQAEIEKLQEFEMRVKLEDLLDLKRAYHHNTSARYETLGSVQGLLLDFQVATALFGKHFAMESILEGWVSYYTNLCNLIDTITDDSSLQDDLPDLKSKLTNCGRTLVVLLEVRYDLVSLCHLALKWTHRCKNNVSDMHVFHKTLRSAQLVDVVVERELNRLLSPNFQLNFYLMSNEVAMDVMDCINEHKQEIGTDKLELVLALRDRLVAKVPEHNVASPPRPPITFEEFRGGRYYRI